MVTDNLLTLKQAAERLHLSEYHFRRTIVNTGKIKVVRFSPRRRFISEDDLEAYIANSKVKYGGG